MTAKIEPTPADEMQAGGIADHEISVEERLHVVLDFEGNRNCAECPEPEPTWACLLNNPLDEKGPRLGIICCYKCYGHLFRLSKDVVTVKSTRRAQEWTEEEVATLASSGNQIVNAIYEAKLAPEDREKAKENMEKFARKKYQELKYFSKTTFKQRYKPNNGSKYFPFPTSTKLTTPSFDWVTFSKGSSSSPKGEKVGDGLDDSSVHSKSGGSSKRKKSPSRGITRALSLRTSKRDKGGDSNSLSAALASPPPQPSLQRTVSNSFGFDRNPSSLFSLSKMMGGTSSSADKLEDESSNSHDDEEEQDPAFRRSLSNPYDMEHMRKESNDFTDNIDEAVDDAEEKNANPHSLDSLFKESGKPVTADDDDSSQMSSRSSRSRRIGKSLQRQRERGGKRSNQQSALGGPNRWESEKKDDDDDDGDGDGEGDGLDASEYSTRSSRSRDTRPRVHRQPSRRGLRPSMSSPVELEAMRKEAASNRNNLLKRGESNRGLQRGGSNRSLKRGESNRSLKRGESDRRLRRGESDRNLRRGQSDRSLRRGQSDRHLKRGASRSRRMGGEADNKDKASNVEERNQEIQQPTSLFAKLEGESEHEEEDDNFHPNRQIPPASSRQQHRRSRDGKGKSDGMDTSGRERSSRGERSRHGKRDSDGMDASNRSSRGERTRDGKRKSDGMDTSGRDRSSKGKSDMDGSKGDRSKRGERSFRDKGKSEMDESRGEKSRRGERSRDGKGKSDVMDKSTRGKSDVMDKSIRGDRSSRGERKAGGRGSDKSKKRDKSPKRKSDGSSKRRSARRASSDSDDKKSLKTIRRQNTNPATLLDESDVEHGITKPSFRRTKSSSSSFGQRRRSSGESVDSTKSRRHCPSEDGNQTKRSPWSPKPIRGDRSSRKPKDTPESSPERSRKPVRRQQRPGQRLREGSKHSSDGQRVKQGITELASLIISSRDMESDRSLMSLSTMGTRDEIPSLADISTTNDNATEKKSGSQTFNSSNSSFLDLVLMTDGRTSTGSASSEEEPGSPTQQPKAKRGSGESSSSSIHSLRSPIKTRKEKAKIPKMGPLEDDDDESSDGSSEDEFAGDNEVKRKGKHDKASTTRPMQDASKSERSHRTTTGYRKPKQDSLSKSERGNRTSNNEKWKSSHGAVEEREETLQDTIMALQAMNHTKVAS